MVLPRNLKKKQKKIWFYIFAQFSFFHTLSMWITCTLQINYIYSVFHPKCVLTHFFFFHGATKFTATFLCPPPRNGGIHFQLLLIFLISLAQELNRLNQRHFLLLNILTMLLRSCFQILVTSRKENSSCTSLVTFRARYVLTCH